MCLHSSRGGGGGERERFLLRLSPKSQKGRHVRGLWPLVIIHFPWLTETLPPLCDLMGFPRGSVVKNPPASAEDEGSIPGLGRSPGGKHGNPLQCSCLENPLGRGAWWATVHAGAKSWTWLKLLSTHVTLCHEPLLVTMESTSSHQQGPTPPTMLCCGKVCVSMAELYPWIIQRVISTLVYLPAS